MAELKPVTKLGVYEKKTFYRSFHLSNSIIEQTTFSVGEYIFQLHDPKLSTSSYIYQIVAIYIDKEDDNNTVTVVGLYYRNARDVCVKGHNSNTAREVLQTCVYEILVPEEINGKLQTIIRDSPKNYPKEALSDSIRYQYRYILESMEGDDGFCPIFTEDTIPTDYKDTFNIPGPKDFKAIMQMVKWTYSKDESSDSDSDSKRDNDSDNDSEELVTSKQTSKRKADTAKRTSKKKPLHKQKRVKEEEKPKNKDVVKKDQNKEQSDSDIVAYFIEAFERFPRKEILSTLSPANFALMFSIASQYMGELTELNKNMKYEA